MGDLATTLVQQLLAIVGARNVRTPRDQGERNLGELIITDLSPSDEQGEWEEDVPGVW